MGARLPIKVMLVEDERIVAFDLTRQLERFGYSVGAVVSSGEQAIREAARERPNLVLMDIHLEGKMDGIDAALAIRADHQIPVIFLTAYAEDDTLHRALASRPFGYLVKPCEGRELHATIQMALARREIEVAVEQSEHRLRLALEAASLGVLEWSPDSNRLTGDSFIGLLLDRRPQALDEPWEDFVARVDPADRARVDATLRATLQSREAIRIEFRTAGDDPAPREIEAHVKAFGGDNGERRVVGILQDVTVRRRDEARLRQSSVVFQTTAEAVVITDAARRIVAVNAAFSRITGFLEDEAIGADPDTLLDATPPFAHYANALAMDGQGYWQGEVDCHKKGGEAFPTWHTVSAVRDAALRATHYVAAFSDVTAIYDAQRQILHMAHHDSLTGLPNRFLFDDRLAHAIAHAIRTQQRCVLLFLDLDGFKVINDTLGHAIGDELLREVGRRLLHALRDSDTIARLGGDEYVILAGGVETRDAAALARKILALLRQPFDVAGKRLSITGSVGIAVYPDNGDNGQALMRAADMAMYTAKSDGRDRFHFYADDMSERAQRRLDTEQGLRRALDEDELVLHYQPRVALAGRHAVGVEALVRWNDPERGLVFPGAFIDIAEECGLIEPIGRFVLSRACSEMLPIVRALQPAPGFHVAVNVSARQFLGPDFVGTVRRVLDETGFPATALELEITESTLQATERSLTILRALEAEGVAVSIDDFGTGYSSLSVLRDLPIKRIKVDRSFITELPESDGQRAIVEAIVALSKALGMSITVEGIETDGQADLLERLDCEEGQGYLFARPMPLDRIMEHLGVSQSRSS
jgi:diguanylate cyclase (GGDEF)-like protein/PAS domain S-box-containing protein